MQQQRVVRVVGAGDGAPKEIILLIVIAVCLYAGITNSQDSTNKSIMALFAGCVTVTRRRNATPRCSKCLTCPPSSPSSAS